jgi:hypothetical protein
MRSHRGVAVSRSSARSRCEALLHRVECGGLDGDRHFVQHAEQVSYAGDGRLRIGG